MVTTEVKKWITKNSIPKQETTKHREYCCTDMRVKTYIKQKTKTKTKKTI
jgi:hypothetical protein